MKEKITPHLRGLINSGSSAVQAQFTFAKTKPGFAFASDDPLGEETIYSPVKGIIHKYTNRVLWKVSFRCAAHCTFCTRIRQIGTPDGDLSNEDIKNGLAYVRQHPEVNDIILSGGDPLVTTKPALAILSGLAQIKSVKVIRIDTRLPIHAPASISSKSLKPLLAKVSFMNKVNPVYILIHANHPDELTREVLKAISILKQTGATLLSQTVFLKEVNDDYQVLSSLFTSLFHAGVIPYYIYRCDYVAGLERFVCSIEKEREIMTELRRNLSGLAIPTYVMDVAGKGKIPVPLEFWDNVDLSKCRDYDNKSITLTEKE